MGLTEQVNALLKSLRKKDEEIIKLKRGIAHVKLLQLDIGLIQRNKRRAYKERYNKLKQIVESVLTEIQDI